MLKGLNSKKKKGKDKISQLKMAELLLTKFTHDMAGPISAVANGIDFVLSDETKDPDEPGAVEIKNQAIDLIEESSKQSMARLHAYRIAYGLVYNADAETKTRELHDIFKNYFTKTQFDLRWNSSVPDVMSSLQRRVLTGMVLTVSRVFIYGAKVSISFSGNNKSIVTVKAHHEKFKEPDFIKDILVDDNGIEPSLDNVAYYFIKQTCDFYGIKINFVYSNDDEKRLEFTCEFPEEYLAKPA